MEIAFVAAEAFPIAKVGGLADVVGSLPQAIKRQGAGSTVFMPWYLGIQGFYVGEVHFYFAGVREKVGIGHIEHEGVRYVLLGMPEFARQNIYGYPDDFRRFLKFQMAVVELLHEFDVVHAHDWQGGLLPLLRNLGWFRARTVFTVHNLAYQGSWDPKDFFEWSRLSGELYYSRGLEHLGKVNLMQCGLINSDVITAVSPRYAQEICTPQGGEGLDQVLRDQRAKLHGILNGLDIQYWNPATDTYIDPKYGLANVSVAKAQLRKTFLAEKGLEDRITLGVVSRFAEQKGIDLILEAIPQLLSMHVNLAVLGSGDPSLEQAFLQAAHNNPGRVFYHQGYSEALAHRIYACCDGFLMPSRFEPCGLSQMIAMRYGTPPIVRCVGGLADTVEHWETGFVFNTADAEGICYGVEEFLMHPDRAKVQKNGMLKDFSWDASAEKYLELYKK
jgi:starch synthase